MSIRADVTKHESDRSIHHRITIIIFEIEQKSSWFLNGGLFSRLHSTLFETLNFWKRVNWWSINSFCLFFNKIYSFFSRFKCIFVILLGVKNNLKLCFCVHRSLFFDFPSRHRCHVYVNPRAYSILIKNSKNFFFFIIRFVLFLSNEGFGKSSFLELRVIMFYPSQASSRPQRAGCHQERKLSNVT